MHSLRLCKGVDEQIKASCSEIKFPIRKLGDALVDEDGADDNWVAGDNRRNAKVSGAAAGLEVALRVEVPAGRLGLLVARVERPEP